MNILIAEDDPLSGRLLQRAVEKFGHESLLARDGAEAWDIYRSVDVDVIISDWIMPGLDGVELCRRVRESVRSNYTYFIFMTALSGKENFLTGMEAGADDYLMKPVDLTELKVSLIAAARVTSLHQELHQQKRELERLNLVLQEQARRDPLTQLYNRLRLREDFEVIRDRMQRYGSNYSVALCDIDYFKSYNDYYGHVAGDEALRGVAQTIAEECRASDLAYRYGGEEFLVVLPEQSIREAVTASERLRASIESLRIPHQAHDPNGVLTVSVGVATGMGDPIKHPESLVKEADIALYRAKTAGRNIVVANTSISEEEFNVSC